MNKLNWNLLRTFVAIVECGGLSKAAARLHRSQPTISTALKQLEDQVGHRLIRRGGTVFEVTAEGTELFRECREILSRIDRLNERMDDAGRLVAGTVKLQVASGIVAPFFDAFMADFHRRYPAADFEMAVGPSVEIQEAVARGDATAGICLSFKDRDDLAYRPFTREHFGFFCGRGHRLFERVDVTVEDLRDEAFVSFQTDRFNDALWPVAHLRMKLGCRGRITGVSPFLETIRRMAIAGLGIAPFPVHAMADDVRLGLLRQLPPYEGLPVIDHFLVTHPGRRPTRVETVFLDELDAELLRLPLPARTYPQD
ncbi:LysR family transcriptional regulator [Zavarzinia sp.]|uniref:LysR family transcriptional regulator n=1 Tax=Zavarzinia sp. TaxID=2027920 RepID=UPI0035671F28